MAAGQPEGPNWAAVVPGDRHRDPDSPPTDPAACVTCHRATTPASTASAPLPRYYDRCFGHVLHPHVNRFFGGFLSSGCRSDRPANVIPHVRRCHCGPERTLSESVHCPRPIEGRLAPVPATKSPLLPLRRQTQTRVQPPHWVETLRFDRSLKGTLLQGTCPFSPDGCGAGIALGGM